MWVSQTFGEKTSLATWKKQDHLKEKKFITDPLLQHGGVSLAKHQII